MRIVITGAGGFLGRALVRQLKGVHDIVAVDRTLGGDEGVEGDIADPAILKTVFHGGCDAVVHLATVAGGAAEQAPETAFASNVDASVQLASAAAAAGSKPRFIFASSVAIYGDALPQVVDDATLPAPHMLYGAHKAMTETWLDTQTRRGAISALSLRLPGLVARPPGPSGMKSAFMSELFHALANGSPILLPVSADATMWLMSVERAAANFRHAIEIEATGAMTLPALRARMVDLVRAVATETGQPANLALYEPDAAIERAFGALPSLETPRAESEGFAADENLQALAASAFETLKRI